LRKDADGMAVIVLLSRYLKITQVSHSEPYNSWRLARSENRNGDKTVI
jgi:hypothetical protein